MFLSIRLGAALAIAALAAPTHAQRVVFSSPWIAQFSPIVNTTDSQNTLAVPGPGSISAFCRTVSGGNTRAIGRVTGSLTIGSSISASANSTATRVQNFARLQPNPPGSVRVRYNPIHTTAASTATSGASGSASTSIVFRTSLTPSVVIAAAAAANQPTTQTVVGPFNQTYNGVNTFFHGATCTASSTGSVTVSGASVNVDLRSRLNGDITLF